MSVGTINRTVRARGFTTVPNELVRNKNLSFRARGILVMVLSHTEDWHTSQGWLVGEGKEGVEAIRSALGELEDAGYLRRSQERNPDGTISKWVMTWFDVPQTPTNGESTSGESTTGLSRSGVSAPTEDYIPENQKTRKPENQKTSDLFLDMEADQGEQPKAKKAPASSAEAEALYQAYPLKAERPEALRAISKALKLKPFGELMAAVERYKKSSRVAAGYVKQPARWFGNQCWNDDMPADPKTKEQIERDIHSKIDPELGW